MKGNPDSRTFEIYLKNRLHSVVHGKMVRNVKFILKQAMEAQRVRRGIALLFH
jgi:hypothetical protein